MDNMEIWDLSKEELIKFLLNNSITNLFCKSEDDFEFWKNTLSKLGVYFGYNHQIPIKYPMSLLIKSLGWQSKKDFEYLNSDIDFCLKGYQSIVDPFDIYKHGAHTRTEVNALYRKIECVSSNIYTTPVNRVNKIAHLNKMEAYRKKLNEGLEPL